MVSTPKLLSLARGSSSSIDWHPARSALNAAALPHRNVAKRFNAVTAMTRLQDLMGLLEGSFQPGDASEVESIVRELEGADVLLPLKEDTCLAPGSYPSSEAALHSQPKRFRQCLKAALLRSVLLTQAEVEAKGWASDAVVQLLQQASSKGALHVAGRQVTIDRFAVAGSVGKGVSVQDDFDIDLVAFVNIPAAVTGISIQLLNPDTTQESDWMGELQQQVLLCLQQLPHLAGKVRQGRTAIGFALSVLCQWRPQSGKQVQLEVDVLLAPNLAAGEGAAAASVWGLEGGSEPAEMQRRAVLAPVLDLMDRAVGTASWNSHRTYHTPTSMPLCVAAVGAVRPSFARNIWLTEAATEFVQQAAVAAADSKGPSGRVVTSTIRLTKAWVRRGLQMQHPGFKKIKSFMIELMVLHAAHTFGSRQRATRVSNDVYEGRYVLDLLLETLAVMIEWANAAAPPEIWLIGALSGAFAAPQQPILFTELVAKKYYSSQQAQALLSLGLLDCRTQESFWLKPLVVVHPVDPLNNVFAQEEGRRFELWCHAT